LNLADRGSGKEFLARLERVAAAEDDLPDATHDVLSDP
jgi:hypothetical protein